MAPKAADKGLKIPRARWDAIPSGCKASADVLTSSKSDRKVFTWVWKAWTAAVGSLATIRQRLADCKAAARTGSRPADGTGMLAVPRCDRQVKGWRTSAGFNVTKRSGMPNQYVMDTSLWRMRRRAESVQGTLPWQD